MFHKMCCLMLLACFTAAAMEQTEATSLTSAARQLVKINKSDTAEGIYLSVLAYEEYQTPALLMDIALMYEKREDKTSAAAFAIKAYQLCVKNPKRDEKEFAELTKLVTKYEPAMPKYTALMHEYQDELTKLAAKHPDALTLEALDKRVDSLHLERKWKKVFVGSDMVGTWDIKMGKEVTGILIINTDGTATSKNWSGAWKLDQSNKRLTVEFDNNGSESARRLRVYEMKGEVWSCVLQDKTVLRPGQQIITKQKDK